MRPKQVNIWSVLALAGGLAYPGLVYASLPHVPSAVLVLTGLALIGLRLWGARRDSGSAAWTLALVTVAIILATLAVVAPHAAIKAYPALLSLAAASVFGASLYWPPNVIERMARIKEPDLSLEGQLYTRRVAQIWTGFLLVNAGVSGATSVWGSTEQWMLWNGLLSYLLMGTLFVGEFILRQYVRRRA